MQIQEHVPLAPKTTMRIGGEARFFAEPTTKEELEELVAFAKEKGLPLITLGGGSNTIFANGVIEAVVMRLKTDEVSVDGNNVIVQSGKLLPVLINDLAEKGLDLSPLTGIPGTIGGAIIGNAGQGPDGIWFDRFIEAVIAFVDGEWKTFTKDDCEFSYRNSIFKKMDVTFIIWEVVLDVPHEDSQKIKTTIEELLNKRIETQPHKKTSGSCFLASNDVPAWKLIDAAGLRGEKSGDAHISEKHANFLINEGNATFDDVTSLIEKIRGTVEEPLEVEMRIVNSNGTLLE